MGEADRVDDGVEQVDASSVEGKRGRAVEQLGHVHPRHELQP